MAYPQEKPSIFEFETVKEKTIVEFLEYLARYEKQNEMSILIAMADINPSEQNLIDQALWYSKVYCVPEVKDYIKFHLLSSIAKKRSGRKEIVEAVKSIKLKLETEMNKPKEIIP